MMTSTLYIYNNSRNELVKSLDLDLCFISILSYVHQTQYMESKQQFFGKSNPHVDVVQFH